MSMARGGNAWHRQAAGCAALRERAADARSARRTRDAGAMAGVARRHLTVRSATIEARSAYARAARQYARASTPALLMPRSPAI